MLGPTTAQLAEAGTHENEVGPRAVGLSVILQPRTAREILHTLGRALIDVRQFMGNEIHGHVVRQLVRRLGVKLD
jgi:hypothetical protein